MSNRLVSLVYLVLIPAMMIAIAVGGLIRTNRIADDGREAKAALCTFKEDLGRRIETAERFLKENPDGIPGIEAETLRNSIENQRRTYMALHLDCEEDQ